MYRKYYQRYDGGYDTSILRSPYSQAEEATVKPEIIVPQAGDDYKDEYEHNITAMAHEEQADNVQTSQKEETEKQLKQESVQESESRIERQKHNRTGFDMFRGNRNEFSLGNIIGRFKLDDWILLAVIIMLFQEGGAVDEVLILVLVFLFIAGL